MNISIQLTIYGITKTINKLNNLRYKICEIFSLFLYYKFSLFSVYCKKNHINSTLKSRLVQAKTRCYLKFFIFISSIFCFFSVIHFLSRHYYVCVRRKISSPNSQMQLVLMIYDSCFIFHQFF